MLAENVHAQVAHVCRAHRSSFAVIVGMHRYITHHEIPLKIFDFPPDPDWPPCLEHNGISGYLDPGKYYWKVTATDGEFFVDGFNSKNVFEKVNCSILPSTISKNIVLQKTAYFSHSGQVRFCASDLGCGASRGVGGARACAYRSELWPK